MTGPVPSRLADTPPEELERLTQAHLDSLFRELNGAAAYVSVNYSPAALVRKHPIATAAAAASAGLFLARALLARGGRAPAGAPDGGPRPSPGRAFGASLLAALASAAGRHLPDLIMMLVRQYGAPTQRDGE